MDVKTIFGEIVNNPGNSITESAELAIDRHIEAALAWIKLAHAEAGGQGISKGYDLVRQRWSPAYPETTGYTIPTLLNVAAVYQQPEWKDMAFALADFLLEAATPEGGVAHWAATDPHPIVFDTGQVMFGWLAAYDSSGDERYLEACKRAGNWLVSIQDASGSWRLHQHLDVEKVIDTRVAWAMLELYRRTDQEAILEAARRNLDWACDQQDTDGWFRKCAFTPEEDPFTHTLAYTAEGLFECGQVLGDDRYVQRARLTADALRAKQYPDGRLVSTYGTGWQETSRSSCLTGNCQMGRLWLRFYEQDHREADRVASEKAINFVVHTQNLSKSNVNIYGAIAGSYPRYGKYERMKYPNWATKFYIDALLTLKQLRHEADALLYVG